jgi:hypothetical protein
MPEDNHSSYPVGYGKPPKRTQFKPGKSGNPNGRPRKSTTLEEDIEKELRTKVTLKEGTKFLQMTKRQAVAKQFVNKAIGGDIRSTELLLKRTAKARSGQDNNLGALLEEFRERSRLLETDRSVQERPLVGSAGSAPSNAIAGEDS